MCQFFWWGSPLYREKYRRWPLSLFGGLRKPFRANLILPPLAGLYTTRNSHLAGNTNVQDRDGADQVIQDAVAKFPSLEKLYVDAGYSGACAVRIQQQHRIKVEVVRHPANRNVGRWVSPDQGELFAVQADSKGFLVLPKRWIVERSHAWYERCRRLIMHHDRLLSVSEAWVWLAGARMLARRLATD